MRRLLLVVVVTCGTAVGVAAGPVLAAGLVGPAANVSELTTLPLERPEVASNARGDTAVAWIDGASGRVFVSERPVRGTFTPGAPVGAVTDAVLGGVAIDDAGTIHVFLVADASTPAAAMPYAATKPLGAAAWTLTPLSPADIATPAQQTIRGAVAPNGAAVVAWAQGNAGDPAEATIQYVRKAAGSAVWSVKGAVPGATGPTADYDVDVTEFGDGALVFTQPGCSGDRLQVAGSTLTASGVWASVNGLSSCAGSDEVHGRPVVAFGPGGTAVATWLRSAGPTARVVQYSTATVGAGPWPTAAASGAADLSAVDAVAGQPALAVAPDGTAIVAWPVGQMVQERTRPPGGVAFAPETTIPASGSNPDDVALAAGADGGVAALWTSSAVLLPVLSPSNIVGSAYRRPGNPTFAPLGGLATRSASPALAPDDEGNFGVAWVHLDPDGSRQRIQATGLDVAPPIVSAVSFPTAVVAQTPFAYTATATDRWSTPTVSWGFGDGTSGPGTGTKAYARPGTYTASLTAYDAVGNEVASSRTVAVAAGPSIAALLPTTPTPVQSTSAVSPFKLTLPKSKRTVKLTRSGHIVLGSISCPAAARACPAAKVTLRPVKRGSGKRRLPVTLARRTFTAKPRTTVRLRLKLTKALTARLRARRSVAVRVTVSATGARTRTVSLTLKRG